MSNITFTDGSAGEFHASSEPTKKEELPPTAAIYPAIKCARPEVFEELLYRLDQWQNEPTNWAADIRRIGGDWTGEFPPHFCHTAPKKMDWEAAKDYIINEKSIPNSQLRETRIALLRAKWYFNLTLDRSSVFDLLPVAQRNPAHHNFMIKALLRASMDGEIQILSRMLYWVMYQIRSTEFGYLNRNNTWVRQDFWLQHLDPISIVWLLEALNSAINFEWLVDANSIVSVGQYTVEEKALANDVWHMIKVRLVYLAEVVFIHMVDADPCHGMRFPVSNIEAVIEGGFWKLTLDGFTGAQSVSVLVEKWPVRALDMHTRDIETELGRLSTWS